MFSRTAASLLLLTVPSLAAPAAMPAGTAALTGTLASSVYAKLLQEATPSVVAVRFQVRPKERPKGGEGPKQRSVTCGVFAGAPGQVVIGGDFFPDIDDGPEALVPYDFRLVLPGGEEVPAEAVGVDRDLNLGFLQAPPERVRSARTVSFDASQEAEVGDEVVIIGLLSEEYDLARTFYTARINAVIERPRRMYSFDVPIQDLALGGLVLLKDGRPLGIVGADLITEGRSEVKSNVLSIISTVATRGQPSYPMVFPYSIFAKSLASPPKFQDEKLETRGWLGIVMQPLSRDLAAYWSIDTSGGVIVTSVLEASPAEKAGLKQGDVIIGVDGQDLPVREQGDLALMQRRIRAAGAGRAIPLSVWRGGEIRPLQVQLASSPVTANVAEEYENETFGLKVRALTYDYLQSMNLPSSTRGVLVTELERAGWAQVADVERRDIVLRVNGEPTPDLTTFRAALEKAEKDRLKEVIFFVLRDYKTQFIRLKTDWRRR